MLPGFPSEPLQIATTGQAGRATLEEAYRFYVECVEAFERFGRPIHPHDHLLDFGCGWGRIGRFFLNDIVPENLYGIDANSELIAVCRRLFEKGKFLTCDPFPPTQLPDGQFSFIVGYSVFSHLSEACCRAWMREFHRLLAPSGIVALTTRGRSFFDYCASLGAQTGLEGYPQALGCLFPDVERVKRRYDAGEFVFATSPGVSGSGSPNEIYYGETFIPERFAREAFRPEMELAEFLCDPARHPQPIMMFRRRPSEESLLRD
jgi:SAM-dependent methyltransferase